MVWFAPKDPWTPAQEAWLLKCVARGISQISLFRQLTGQTPGRPADVPASTIEYEAFKKRMKKLTAGNAVELGDRRKRIAQRKLNAIDIDTPDGQLAFLRTLILDNTLNTNDKLRAFEKFVELQSTTEGSDDGKVLLTDPLYCKLDVAVVTELIFSLRTEYGGLDKLDYSFLPNGELESLIDALRELRQKRALAEVTSTEIDLSSHDSDDEATGAEIDPFSTPRDDDASQNASEDH